MNECPRCKKKSLLNDNSYNILSRKGDKIICFDCGIDEAMISAFGKRKSDIDKSADMNFIIKFDESGRLNINGVDKHEKNK